MCQWRRIQFHQSTPSAFCLSHYTACYLRWTTLSSAEYLPSWNTFCKDFASHHGCSIIQHCLCEDKCTTSQVRATYPISPHLFGFWNSYLRVTCWTTHVSLLVVYGEFMHNSNCNYWNIASLVPTNLRVSIPRN